MKLYYWTDDRRIPDSLIQLLGIPDLPGDLRKEILQAAKEVEESGAVAYPTKARVEYYLHQHREYILKLMEKLEEQEPGS